MFRVAAASALCALAIGCSDRHDSSGKNPSDPPAQGDGLAIELREATFDAHPDPRPGNPLVAGEGVRIGVWMRGGEPPLSLSVRVITAKGEPALAETLRAPEREGWAEIVVAGNLRKDAPSAAYWADVRLTDANGHEAHAVSEEIQVIGADAEVLPAPDAPTYVQVLDIAGRARVSFVRGERVSLSASLGPFTGKLVIRVRSPGNRPLTAVERNREHPSDELSVPFAIPRLAPPGAYTVEVELADGRTLYSPLVVRAKPFSPVATLTVDQMWLWGGEDSRSRRTGRLHRGESMVVEARVGGIHEQADIRLRLRDRAGKVVKRVRFDPAAIRTPRPDVRTYARGKLEVATDLAPGRYVLELEVTEGDDVSTRYREVLVD